MRKYQVLFVVCCLLAACAPMGAPQPVYGMGIEVHHVAEEVPDDVVIVIDQSTLSEENVGEAICRQIIEPISITEDGEGISFLRCGDPRGDRMGVIVMVPNENGYQLFMLAINDGGQPWSGATAQAVMNGVTYTIPASLDYLNVINVTGAGTPDLTAPEGCTFHTGQMVWFFTCSTTPLTTQNA